MNRLTFPTLFAMAMDYLPVQATSVPCEHIFLSSGETNTKRRSHINPLTMEALQMLKFHLKKERLDFTKGWMTSEKQIVDDSPDRDLLVELLEGDLQDGVDKVMRHIKNKLA